MQKDRQTSKDNDHDQAYPLHGINLAMTVINPKYLADGGNHGDDGGRVDICKLKSNKEQNDGKEVK